MSDIRLFKLQTTVLAVFLLGISLAGFNSAYASNSDDDSGFMCDARAEGIDRAKLKARSLGISLKSGNSLSEITDGVSLTGSNFTDLSQAYDEGFNKCNPSVSENSPNACNDANKEYNKVINEFSASCAKVNIRGDAKACFTQIQDCTHASAFTYSTPTASLNDSVKSFTSAFQGQSVQSTPPRAVVPDSESADNRFRACPMYAGEDLKDWRETVESSEEKVKALQEQINNAQTELTDLQTEAAAEMKRIQDEITDVQQQGKDEVRNIKNEMEEYDEGLADQVLQVEGAIAAQNKNIDDLLSARVDATNAFYQAKTTLNLQCHAAALTKVAQLQQAKQALISQSRYTSGGFNKLLSSVGLSNEEAAEKLAKKYYDRCLSDRAYVDNLEIAKRANDAANSRIDKAISQARDRIATLTDQIHRIQGELKMKGMMRFMERLQSLEEKITTEIRKLQESLILTNQKYAALIANKQNALGQLNADLATQQNYLTQRRAYYDIKLQHATGEFTAADVSDVTAKAGAVSTAASEVVSTCGGSNDTTSQGRCEKVINFLGEDSGQDSDNCYPAQTYPDPTAPPAPSAPAGPSGVEGV